MEPQLGLGILNAWLFFLLDWLPMPLLRHFRPDVLRLLNSGEPTVEQRRRRTAVWLLFLAGFVYALFLPLRVGAPWFYIGMTIALVGFCFYGSAVRAMLAWPDLNRPIVNGSYRFSRHPLYVGEVVMFAGAAVASSSVLLAAYAVAMFVLHASNAESEEADCVERYGETYADYLGRTPRWLGLPHSGG
ncbi:MAG: DUF1295 domain-containing protein [Dehalococcoidia bacterium]|nr:DUF1295 domain-containing protein [Dehalococcoidia bacterium]